MISFFEYTLQINERYLDAFRIFCKVKDGQEEKTEKEWKELFSKFLTKKTH